MNEAPQQIPDQQPVASQPEQQVPVQPEQPVVIPEQPQTRWLLLVLALGVALAAYVGVAYWQGVWPFEKAYEEDNILISPTPTPVSTVTEEAKGYIKDIYEADGKRYLDIDYIQMLAVKEALRKAIELRDPCIWDGVVSEEELLRQVEEIELYSEEYFNSDIGSKGHGCMPNGYMIFNQNPRIRTFEISENVKIERRTAFEYSNDGVKIINYQELKDLFASKKSFFEVIPYNIKVVDSKVTEIVEQYIP